MERREIVRGEAIRGSKSIRASAQLRCSPSVLSQLTCSCMPAQVASLATPLHSLGSQVQRQVRQRAHDRGSSNQVFAEAVPEAVSAEVLVLRRVASRLVLRSTLHAGHAVLQRGPGRASCLSRLCLPTPSYFLYTSSLPAARFQIHPVACKPPPLPPRNAPQLRSSHSPRPPAWRDLCHMRLALVEQNALPFVQSRAVHVEKLPGVAAGATSTR